MDVCMILVFYGITLLPITLSWLLKQWFSYKKKGHNQAPDANIHKYDIFLYRQFKAILCVRDMDKTPNSRKTMSIIELLYLYIWCQKHC